MEDKITVLTPYERDSDNITWIQPKVDTVNPRNAESLSKILQHKYDEGGETVLDLFYVNNMTNLGARMLCKTLYGRNIIIENVKPAVQTSLEWAADYLYRKGELDNIPWQVSDLLL